MKQQLSLILLLSCLLTTAHAQRHILFLKGGKTEYVDVIEIGETNIRYYKADRTEGPVYTKAKTKIRSIHFADGSQEIYSSSLSYDQVKFRSANFLEWRGSSLGGATLNTELQIAPARNFALLLRAGAGVGKVEESMIPLFPVLLGTQLFAWGKHQRTHLEIGAGGLFQIRNGGNLWVDPTSVFGLRFQGEKGLLLRLTLSQSLIQQKTWLGEGAVQTNYSIKLGAGLSMGIVL